MVEELKEIFWHNRDQNPDRFLDRSLWTERDTRWRGKALREISFKCCKCHLQLNAPRGYSPDEIGVADGLQKTGLVIVPDYNFVGFTSEELPGYFELD